MLPTPKYSLSSSIVVLSPLYLLDRRYLLLLPLLRATTLIGIVVHNHDSIVVE